MNSDLSSSTSEYGIRLDLLMKTHQEIINTVLPALHNAIENVTNFMYEPDADDEEIHAHLRAWATESLIDELTRLLLHDPIPASRSHAIINAGGIEYDTLMTSYDELAPESVKRWYAHLLGVQVDEYNQWMESIPTRMSY